MTTRYTQVKSRFHFLGLVLLTLSVIAGTKANAAAWPAGTVLSYERHYLKTNVKEYFQREFIGVDTKGQMMIKESGPGTFPVAYAYSDFYERYSLQYLSNKCKDNVKVIVISGLGSVRVCYAAGIGMSPDVPLGYTEVIPMNSAKYSPHRDTLLSVKLPHK